MSSRPSVPPVGRAADRPDTTAPDGSLIFVVVTGAHGATRASVVEVVLPAGAVSRPVAHRTVEEIWYVLSGRGTVWRAPPGVDLPPVSVGPADALVIPCGWRFQFRAEGPGPLRFLCVTVPPWPGPQEAVAVDAGGLGPPTV